MIVDRFFEVLFLGVRSIWRNKLRFFLTMLGMIFGVGSVIAMLSVGASARHETLTRIQELGIRNIIINLVNPPEEVQSENDEQAYKNSFEIKHQRCWLHPRNLAQCRTLVAGQPCAHATLARTIRRPSPSSAASWVV
ncbi:MAG: ABC-type lipoprotein release transport system permease subunit [Planctomycetota bacterium]